MKSPFDQTLPIAAHDVLALMNKCRGWEAKYRQIMQLGKQLQALDDSFKQEAFLVKGCESQVWLHHRFDDSGKLQLAADSDARIVKGLVVIVLAAFQGKTRSQLSAFDIEDYFARMDLLKHLSPSRSNGIHAIVQTIRDLAHAAV